MSNVLQTSITISASQSILGLKKIKLISVEVTQHSLELIDFQSNLVSLGKTSFNLSHVQLNYRRT